MALAEGGGGYRVSVGANSAYKFTQMKDKANLRKDQEKEGK